jgi:hypothetical protein
LSMCRPDTSIFRHQYFPFSGANPFFPEAGESDEQDAQDNCPDRKEGFTTALWRQSNEITTADCRSMLIAAGFSSLMDTNGHPNKPLQATAYNRA